jgi:alpha-tubulin suppressor-like RCC1 family protein
MGANLNAIIATFSEALDVNTVTNSSFAVNGPLGLVSGAVSLSNKGKVVTFKPSTPLAFGARYEVKLTTEIQDLAGNSLAVEFGWSFNTGKQLALNSYGEHTCARLPVTPIGALKCWGYNAFGQLGQGDILNRGDSLTDMGAGLLPVNLGIGLSAVQVAAGVDHTCARLDNLQVKCWGENAYGQLGIGNIERIGDGPDEMGQALIAVDLGTGRYALELVAGFGYTCARLDNGGVKCWGNAVALGLRESFSSRGDGSNEMGDALPYVDLGTNRKAVALYAGWAHTCARLDNATVKCWGKNSDGQLGLGDTVTRGVAPSQMGDNLPALDFGLFLSALQLSLGERHTCVLLGDYNVKCWGSGLSGRLGLGNTLSYGNATGRMGNDLPVVNLGRNALEISAGAEHTCARLDDGTTKCWGANGAGQLGVGDADNRGDGAGEMGGQLPVVNLGTALHASELVTGQLHNCARLDNNTIKCWGFNASGQLGAGDTFARGAQAAEMGDALLPVDLGGP